MSGLIGFPNPVNEKAARVVAAGVLVASVATLALSLAVSREWLWVTAALALGFIARVATGPKLSVLGQLATRVIAPRLGPAKLVPGPPKRFAQAIGAVVTSAATLFFLAGVPVVTQALLGLMIVAAGLEAIFGLCIGCVLFGWLIRAGVIPESVCVACADITARYAPTAG